MIRFEFTGNLVADPETRTTQSGKDICNFKVANNRNWVDGKGEKMEVTTYVRIAVSGPTAVACQKYLHKGSKVLVSGYAPTTSPYLDNEGKPQASLEMWANDVEFLDGKNGNSGSNNSSQGDDSSEKPAPSSKPAPASGKGTNVPF